MDAATDSKVEVKGSMEVSQDDWDKIFKPKSMTEEHAKYVLDQLGWYKEDSE